MLIDVLFVSLRRCAASLAKALYESGQRATVPAAYAASGSQQPLRCLCIFGVRAGRPRFSATVVVLQACA